MFWQKKAGVCVCGGGDKGKLAKTFIKDVGNSVCQMKGKISKGNKWIDKET